MIRREIELCVVLALLSSLFGCQHSLPPVERISAPQKVAIYQTGDKGIPDLSSCRPRGRLTASDGLLNTNRPYYVGTQERATKKLENEAIRFSADTVIIKKRFVTVNKTPNLLGNEVVLYANSYNCNWGKE